MTLRVASILPYTVLKVFSFQDYPTATPHGLARAIGGVPVQDLLSQGLGAWSLVAAVTCGWPVCLAHDERVRVEPAGAAVAGRGARD